MNLRLSILIVLTISFQYAFPEDGIGGMPLPNPCSSAPAKGFVTITPSESLKGNPPDGYLDNYYEYSCLDRKLQGKYTTFDGGNKTFEGHYEQGQKSGIFKKWYPGTTALESEVLYEKDNLLYVKRWSKEGKLEHYSDNTDNPFSIEWNDKGEIIAEDGLPPKKLPADVKKALNTPKALNTSHVALIPESIIKKSDQYIIDKVGLEYFKNQYRLLRERSKYSKDNNTGSIEYWLTYEYKPLKNIGSDGLIGVNLVSRPNKVPSIIIHDRFVAQIENGKVLEPNITKGKAIEIAFDLGEKRLKRDNFKIYLMIPNWVNELRSITWKLSSPLPLAHEHGCIEKIEILINAITGKATNKGVVEEGCY